MKSEKEKEHYEFRWYDTDENTVVFEIDIDEDNMNCYRLHDYCKRFAVACGYMPETVEKIFGKTDYDAILD